MTTPRGHWFSGFVLAFVGFLTISTHLASCQVDLTIQPGESGKDVVEATLARFDSFKTVQKLSSVVGDEFLRRVAYVETKFGMDGHTFRDGYHGGIWQIDENNFELTKSSSLPDISSLRTEINDLFQIDWTAVPWGNLRKPLYSALAARLLISTFPIGPPPSVQIDLQAEYWKEHYDTSSGLGTKEGFINDVDELLDSEQCFLSKLDLAFVVDGSGSVTQDNFDISKEFVQGMVEKFEVGPERIRVGLIQYSTSPSVVEFGLNEYTEKDELLSAIGNVVYQDGGRTLTGSAINAMVSDLFGEGKGARSIDDVPRVGIIMTDGASQEDVLGPANAARAEGITLFAIGIGGYNPVELKQIASVPDYIFEVNNFNVVTNIQALVSKEACEEPFVFGNTNLGKSSVQRLQAMSRVYFEFQLPPSNVMTITMNATMGEISAYFSNQVTNPNPAFHQWSAHASEENPVAQVFINATEEDPSRQKRQAELQQVYGTIINTYNVSTSDMSGVNGTDVNATAAIIPETVFTLVTEEGDTRIVIPTTPTYTTSRISTPVIPTTLTSTTNRITTRMVPTTPTYTTSRISTPVIPTTLTSTTNRISTPVIPTTLTSTTNRISTPGDIDTTTTGYTISRFVATKNASTGLTPSSSIAPENANTGYTTSTSVAPENPNTGYSTFTSVAPENPTTGYMTSTSVAPENPTTGYTTSTSVASDNPTTGYTTSTSVAPENAKTGYTTSSSVVTENASEEITDNYVTENIRAANNSRLSAGGVAGIIIVIFILLILIVVTVAVYLIKRRNTEVKPDEEATDMAQMSSTKADTDTESDSMRYETTKVSQGDIGLTDSAETVDEKQKVAEETPSTEVPTGDIATKEADNDAKTVDETQKEVEEMPPTNIHTGETQAKEGDTDAKVDVGAQSDPVNDDKIQQPDVEAENNDTEAENQVSDAKATEEGNKDNSETNAACDQE